MTPQTIKISEEERKILSDNELIAQFMELPSQDGIEDGYTLYSHTDWEGGEWAYDKNNLAYDKSWDWLIPVLEKIESMPNCVVEFKKELCHITFCNSDGMIIHEHKSFLKGGMTKIEAVYQAVISFIKWYQNTK